MCVCVCVCVCVHLQAGFVSTLGMLMIGYTVILSTVFSISAIVTSANVEGGGVYCILKKLGNKDLIDDLVTSVTEWRALYLTLY